MTIGPSATARRSVHSPRPIESGGRWYARRGPRACCRRDPDRRHHHRPLDVAVDGPRAGRAIPPGVPCSPAPRKTPADGGSNAADDAVPTLCPPTARPPRSSRGRAEGRISGPSCRHSAAQSTRAGRKPASSRRPDDRRSPRVVASAPSRSLRGVLTTRPRVTERRKHSLADLTSGKKAESAVGRDWVVTRSRDNVGIVFSVQLQKLKGHHWATVTMKVMVAQDVKRRKLALLLPSQPASCLTHIDIRRVARHVREEPRLYQPEVVVPGTTVTPSRPPWTSAAVGHRRPGQPKRWARRREAPRGRRKSLQ